jgi:predicted transglutaminase-like cysteine proteinase
LLFAIVLVSVHRAEGSAPPIIPRYVSPPAGFISFCIRFPDQCASEGATEVVLTDERWRVLERINTDVNWAIRPEDDQTHYGRPEYWTIPSDGFGDCEDYALTKRRALLEAGFPLRALRIAIVNSAQSGRHAVLTVISDRGAFVLDNLTDAIRERHQTAYLWIEQQDANNPHAWVSLDTGGDIPSPSAVGTTSH